MKNNKDQLVVAETFYSIQGEGITSGVPAVFLRLGGCNLFCNSKHWRCDTIEVWQKGKSIEFKNILLTEYVTKLQNGAHLIITGGEPLLQEKQLGRYLFWFKVHYGFLPFIEVETNGTILPGVAFAGLVDNWNVSFKLSSSGESWSRRINELALKWFSMQLTANFKIVISNEGDVLELINDFQGLINFKKVVLMPAGATQEELNKTRDIVVNAAKDLCFRYCDRLHIIIWNKKTGV